MMAPSNKRILFTIICFPPSIGGAEIHTLMLASKLAERHPVEVVCQWNEQRRDWLFGTTVCAPARSLEYVQEGIRVCRIGLSLSQKLQALPFAFLFYFLNRVSVRVLSSLLLRNMRQAIEAPLALVHNVRVGRETLSVASLRLARQHRVPFVFTPNHHPRWRTWFHRGYLQIYRQADVLIALTEAERELYCEMGLDPSRIFVTGIGPVLSPDYDVEAFRTRYGIPPSAPVVLFLGQKYRYKGLEDLLFAAGKFRDVAFLFVGPRTDFSRRLFGSIQAANIIEVGSVGQEEKTAALACCDLLCLPSRQESFGGVFVEAWSLGKPVIGVDIPAVKSVISHGVDGLVVTPNAEALTSAIEHLLNRPQLRAEMGRAGKRKVVERYTWDRIVMRTWQAYCSVLPKQAEAVDDHGFPAAV